MSATLMVFFPEPPAGYLADWNAALKRRGIAALAVDEGDWEERGEFVLCPPLQPDEPGYPGFWEPEDGMVIEVGDFRIVDWEQDADLTATELDALRPCLYTARIPLSRGPGILWQIEGVPAMVEALRGVLCDPQCMCSDALRAAGRSGVMVTHGLVIGQQNVDEWAGLALRVLAPLVAEG